MRRRQVVASYGRPTSLRLLAEAPVNWRRAALLTVLALLFAPAAGEAQERKSVPRLCFLTLDPGSVESPSRRYVAFFAALRGLGYVHGQTIKIDYLVASARGDNFQALADNCVRQGADIIAVTTTPAAKAAKAATRSVPIVMTSLADPVRTGLVDSLARPGGNVTGMSNMGIELAAKRLSLLKEAVPRVSRVLVLTYLADPIVPLQVEVLKEAATALGVSLVFRDSRTAEDLPAAFDAGARDRADGLLVTTVSLFSIARAAIAELAARHRLPAIFPHLPARDAGGLLVYHVDEHDMLTRAAGYVDRILRGSRPSELPVQQPTKFGLIVNLRTAKALGIAISPSLIARADEVIE